MFYLYMCFVLSFSWVHFHQKRILFKKTWFKVGETWLQGVSSNFNLYFSCFWNYPWKSIFRPYQDQLPYYWILLADGERFATTKRWVGEEHNNWYFLNYLRLVIKLSQIRSGTNVSFISDCPVAEYCPPNIGGSSRFSKIFQTRRSWTVTCNFNIVLDFENLLYCS